MVVSLFQFFKSVLGEPVAYFHFLLSQLLGQLPVILKSQFQFPTTNSGSPNGVSCIWSWIWINYKAYISWKFIFLVKCQLNVYNFNSFKVLQTSLELCFLEGFYVGYTFYCAHVHTQPHCCRHISRNCRFQIEMNSDQILFHLHLSWSTWGSHLK